MPTASQAHNRSFRVMPSLVCVLAVLLLAVIRMFASSAVQDDSSHRSLTPLQLEIEKQRERLSSGDVEERRDAAMRLGVLRQPAAAKVAVTALADVSIPVRVAAMNAVLWLPPEESAAVLVPLLKDKDEFVRQETAYALGKTRSRAAVAPLLELLGTEKKAGVRGAAATSLGQIGDEAAVMPLAQMLAPRLAMAPSKRRNEAREENEFVLRAAARSLGQIGSRSGVSSLIATLENEQNAADVRREAALALGLIGDPQAVPVLRGLLANPDPYLSLAAQNSLRRLAPR